MNVLLIGSGGREHALGWKLSRSKRCGKVYFLPGNAGTAEVGENVAGIDLSSVTAKSADEVVRFCKDKKIELVVIGPEAPLAQGLTDRLQRAGLRVFGPTQAGAQIESDKAWAKQLMRAALVPTAESRTFTDAESAREYVEAHETPVVVKAAGLAGGKGVIVCDDAAEARDAVRRIMVDREFGEAGETVVVDERLSGQEVSILALVDGSNIYVLTPSQDHKPAGEGDTGPNTGGMGAYTPTPVVDEATMERIERDVLVPTVDALRREGVDYRGVLYAGLMLTAGGPKVLEFNCRFGDPECQPVMARMKADLLEVMLATCDGRLDEVEIGWDRRTACCVVVCSGGYPGQYEKGLPIDGLDEAAAMDDVHLFHAGTKRDKDGRIVTAGGRVVSVVGLGDDLAQARETANAAAAKVRFDGAFYRRDIGARVLKAEPR